MKKQKHVEKISSDISSVAWYSKGEKFVSGSNKTLIIWVKKEYIGHGYKILKRLFGHEHIINSVDWSHDGNLIVSGSSDRTIKVWNPDNGRCIKTIKPITNREYLSFNSVAFCPINSNLIVSTSTNNLLQIWNINNGTCIANLIRDNKNKYPNIRFESAA